MVITTSMTFSRVDAQAPTLQKVFTIGCENCGGALEFTGITDVALNTRGELLVADREAPFLRQFDAAGKPTWQGGVKGKGPGEFTTITRIGWLANGAYNLVDGSGNRVTSLARDHSLSGTAVLSAYATTAATNDGGAVIIGQEAPMGKGFTLLRMKAGAFEKLTPPTAPGKPAPTYNAASVAVSSAGVIALWPHSDRYEILRMDSTGSPLSSLTRAIERIHYTTVEDSIRRARMDKELAQMRAMAGIKSAPPAPNGPPPLKPFAWGDGLRYDPKGRLWAQTNQGDETHTVFDVFSPTGVFLGSVNVPGVVRQFALGGTWLATSTENEDGVLQVTKWSVR